MAEPKTRPRVALVGGDSLLAREIHGLLRQVSPAPLIEMISASAENAVILSAVDDAEEDGAAVLTPLSAQSLAGAQVAFLAGSPASSRRALKLNPRGGPVLVDVTGALEDQPNARLRAPSVEAGARSREQSIDVIAHPAAIAIAALLAVIARRAVLRRIIIHIFEPASERGKKGIDELQQQTVAVLSFKKLKTEVFDAQLGFNLLARYGEEALEPLESVEQRIEKHLASLLAAFPSIPMPSLRLIQAPVFHGHSFSAWLEFEENPGPGSLAKILEDAGLDVRVDDPPSNVGITGQSGLSIGAIATDSNQPRACWLWAVADNLKLSAENAVAVARECLR